MPRLSLRRSLTVGEGSLALFAVACVFAYVRAQGWWIVGLPVLVSLGVSLGNPSPHARRLVERSAWMLVGLACLVGIGWTLYFLQVEERIAELRGVIGAGLVVLVATFLAGHRVWRPERGLVPTGLAILVLSGLGSVARLTPSAAVAALGLVGWLIVERPAGSRDSGQSRPRWAPVFLFMALATGTAAGVIRVLPMAQPFVERAARSLTSGSSGGSAGLSESGELGAVERLGLSREVVLRLWSDRPTMLRARVLTTFDGRAWTAPEGEVLPLTPAPSVPAGALRERIEGMPGATFGTGAPIDGDAEWARILLASSSRGWMVTPRQPLLVRVAGGTPSIDGAGIVTAPFRPAPAMYGVTHGAPALTPLSAEERAASVQLPDGLDPRLTELAEQMFAQSTSDAERVDSTLAWIGRCCRYSLDVGRFSSEQPVAEFLFEKRRGYCEYFASAAAILLRLQGVPTRYVTGLNVQPANRRGDHFLVRASDAHAWIEVWLEGVGWVAADPTPAAQYAALRVGLRDGWLRRAWESISAFAAELRARAETDWRDALTWLAVGAGSLLARLARRWELGIALFLVVAAVLAGRRLLPRLRRRPRPASAISLVSVVGPELADLMQRLEGRWSSLGHPRPVHRAPLEHLESLSEGALPLSLLASSRGAVDCYYRARFGGYRPDPDEIYRLRNALD